MVNFFIVKGSLQYANRVMIAYHKDRDCDIQLNNLTKYNCEEILKEEHSSVKKERR